MNFSKLRQLGTTLGVMGMLFGSACSKNKTETLAPSETIETTSHQKARLLENARQSLRQVLPPYTSKSATSQISKTDLSPLNEKLNKEGLAMEAARKKWSEITIQKNPEGPLDGIDTDAQGQKIEKKPARKKVKKKAVPLPIPHRPNTPFTSQTAQVNALVCDPESDVTELELCDLEEISDDGAKSHATPPPSNNAIPPLDPESPQQDSSDRTDQIVVPVAMTTRDRLKSLLLSLGIALAAGSFIKRNVRQLAHQKAMLTVQLSMAATSAKTPLPPEHSQKTHLTPPNEGPTSMADEGAIMLNIRETDKKAEWEAMMWEDILRGRGEAAQTPEGRRNVLVFREFETPDVTVPFWEAIDDRSAPIEYEELDEEGIDEMAILEAKPGHDRENHSAEDEEMLEAKGAEEMPFGPPAHELSGEIPPVSLSEPAISVREMARLFMEEVKRDETTPQEVISTDWSEILEGEDLSPPKPLLYPDRHLLSSADIDTAFLEVPNPIAGTPGIPDKENLEKEWEKGWDELADEESDASEIKAHTFTTEEEKLDLAPLNLLNPLDGLFVENTVNLANGMTASANGIAIDPKLLTEFFEKGGRKSS